MRMEYTPEMRVSSERGCPRASHEARRWRHRPGSMCSSVRCSSASMVLTMYLLRHGARVGGWAAVEVWAAVGFGQGLGLGHRGGVGPGRAPAVDGEEEEASSLRLRELVLPRGDVSLAVSRALARGDVALAAHLLRLRVRVRVRAWLRVRVRVWLRVRLRARVRVRVRCSSRCSLRTPHAAATATRAARTRGRPRRAAAGRPTPPRQAGVRRGWRTSPRRA